jgi:hypothetical protein
MDYNLDLCYKGEGKGWEEGVEKEGRGGMEGEDRGGEGRGEGGEESQCTLPQKNPGYAYDSSRPFVFKAVIQMGLNRSRVSKRTGQIKKWSSPL